MASLLNSIGAFAAEMGPFGAAQARDAILPRGLMNSGLPGEPDATTAAAAAPAPAAPGAAAATPTDKGTVAVPAGKGTIAVPAALMPIYQAAAARTGIPVAVLIAQGKQESDFNPNAVGSAGEIGIHQIKPSTAADPGYGLKGIDPRTLQDPSANINFAADYLKARAGNPNFNDPASVDAALAAYNSGGDPNYVANVRRYMGAPS